MPVLNAFAHGGMDDPVAVLSKYGYGLLLAFAMAIVAFILLLPISVRRLHDRNMSGWWMLVFLLGGILPYVGCLFGVAQFVIMGCLAGKPGPNRFGSDPKETESTAEKTQL